VLPQPNDRREDRSLPARLRRRIAEAGPISFANFMEAALYDTEEGYYARGGRIGEGGDFVTSPTLSPLFAAVLARRFARDASRLDGPVDFVEVGAGDGRFLEDFSIALARESPDAIPRLRLTGVERSAASRETLARRRIEPAPRLLAGVQEIEPGSVSGWIFANELFDALPVVRLRGLPGGGVEELRVGLGQGRFVWTRVPSTQAQRESLARFGIVLEAGQVGEISPGAAPLYRRLARALVRGRLVLFDYGHRARVLYHPLARRGGTLAVHEAGRRGGDPLERPGELDLTAHVNWDELERAGLEEGLRTDLLRRQGRFLIESGIFDLASSEREKWGAYRIVDPEGMGEEISVLVQSRAIEPMF
jgi:SAM-dependent MidA family methyltransferase